jgi:hypothetical protein
MIERANRTIENMLSAFVDKNQKNWDELVPLLMLAYRSSVHESIGISPNEMVFGRQVTLPIDLVLGRTDPERNDISDYIRNLSEKIDKVHSFARNNLELNSQNMLREYNAKIQHNPYKSGDLVWVYYPNQNLGLERKLSRHWAGPFKIKEKINDVLYKIQKHPRHRGEIIHHNRLKPYNGTDIPKWFHA